VLAARSVEVGWKHVAEGSAAEQAGGGSFGNPIECKECRQNATITETQRYAYHSSTTLARLPTPSVIQQHPIEHAVLDLSLILQHFRKQIPQEIIIGRLLKSEFPHIIQINGKFFGFFDAHALMLYWIDVGGTDEHMYMQGVQQIFEELGGVQKR